MNLIDAAKNGDLETVLNILESGYAANLRDKDNATALYWSACHGYDDVTEVLISAGCDVNAAVRWGSTALHAAADRGHMKCVQMLIESGANPNSTNNRGDSALHISAYRGFMEITNVLLLAGSDVSLINEKGKTPKQEALEGGNSDVAECIRVFESEGGISTNTRGDLHYSAASGSQISGNTIYCSPQSNNLSVTHNGWLPSISTESSDFNESFASSMSTSESSLPEDYVDSGTVPTSHPRNVQLRRSVSFAGTHKANRNILPVGVTPRTPSLENISVEERIYRNMHFHDQTHFKSEPYGRLRITDVNLNNGCRTITRVSAYDNPVTQKTVMTEQHPSESVDQREKINVIQGVEPDILIRKYGPVNIETSRPARSSVGSVVDIINKSKDTAIHALQNQLIDSYKQIETLTKENEHLKFKSSTLLDRLTETESKLSDMVLKCDTLKELLKIQNKSFNGSERCKSFNEGYSTEAEDSNYGFKELVRRFDDMPNVLEERLRETVVDLHTRLVNTGKDSIVNEEWLPDTDYVILGDPPISRSVNDKLPFFVSFLIRQLRTNKSYILKMKVLLAINTQSGIYPAAIEPSRQKHQSQLNIIKILHQYESSTERLKKFVYIPHAHDQNLPQRQLASRTTFLVTPNMFTLRKILEMCSESKIISTDRGMNVTFWIYVVYQLTSVLCLLEDKSISIGDIDVDTIEFDEELVPYFEDIENVIELHQDEGAETNRVQRDPDDFEESAKFKNKEKLCSNDISRLCSLFYNILFLKNTGSGPIFSVQRQTGNTSAQEATLTKEALRHILIDATNSSSNLFHEENTARNMCRRLGFLLFGPGLTTVQTEEECRIYCQIRMLDILSKTTLRTSKIQLGEIATMEESILNNRLRIEAHFWSHVTSCELWRYCRLFEQNGLSTK